MGSSEVLAAGQLREVAHEAHAAAHGELLERRYVVDRREPEAADQLGGRQVVREQAVEAIRHAEREPYVRAPPTLVAQERLAVADIAAGARAFGEDLGERGDVAHTEVEALSVDRVQAVCRIAHQSQAR